ncbi:uncharacterized protein LOC141633985 [Silene latifolia]|uniref:uncharacterized protein LOC141633985 n=1 Tax=Silene latifolia TaxID=37657 RepID=UPI003D7818BA
MKTRGGLKRACARNNNTDEECRAKEVRRKTKEDVTLKKKNNSTNDDLEDDEVEWNNTRENMEDMSEDESEKEDENGDEDGDDDDDYSDEDCSNGDGDGDEDGDEDERISDSEGEEEEEEEGDDVDENEYVASKEITAVDENEDPASKEIAVSNKSLGRRTKSRGKRGIPTSLRTRLCIANFQNFIKRLSPKQREAVNEIGFGCLLELEITQICGNLGMWLVRNINPYSLELTLAPNSSFRITEVDVYLALKLSCGPKYVEEAKDRGNDEVVQDSILKWKRRWGVSKGVTAPVTTKMPNEILNHGHDDDFKVDFVIYTFSSLLYGHQARHCNYKLLMSLLEPSQICNFNWCQYVIRALVKAVKEFRKNPSGFFCGPLIVVLLCYLDRVEFESRTFERKFPILSGWDDKKVTERRDAELREDGYGQGYVVPRMNLIKLHQLGCVPDQDFVRLNQILMNLPTLDNQSEGGPSVDVDIIPPSTDIGERKGRGDQGTSSSQIHNDKKVYIEKVMAVNKKLSSSVLEWNEVMNEASKFFPSSNFTFFKKCLSMSFIWVVRVLIRWKRNQVK